MPLPPSQQEALSERALCVLSGIIMLIQAAMGMDDPVTPTPLRDTLQILHGEMLQLLIGNL